MKKQSKIALTVAAIIAGFVFVPKIVTAVKQKRLAAAQVVVREITKQLPSVKVGTKDRQILIAALNRAKQEIVNIKADLGLV